MLPFFPSVRIPAPRPIALLALALVLLPPGARADDPPATKAASADAARFADVTAQLGIDFVHQDARFGLKYYVETAASGGGWFDADGDGDLDLYLINGAATPGSSIEGTPRNALYENRGGRFVEIGRASGTDDDGYGMGVCAGDVDGDGRLDFLVTNYGPDRLYRARDDRALGDGRFEEIAAKAGVDDPRWGASCAFGDLDGDGDLDLYVTHYVDFRYDQNPFCGDRARNLRAYCRPEAFPGVADSLFLNQGDGTFIEDGKARGIVHSADEKGFGVVLADIDDDGDLDIYVANDGTLNRLYLNDGKARFTDEALLAGVGLSGRGVAESGMGVDLGDVDADGRLDVLVTNYSMETNTLYRNEGDLLFEDVSSKIGLGVASYPYVGWGVTFFDMENDGDLDVAVANGHAVDNIEIFEAGLQYAQPNQLFENAGDGRFREAAAVAGAAWSEAHVSRGLAIGDYDDDGRLDVLFTHTNDAPQVLRNVGPTGHWVGVRLVGPAKNPLAIGARATLDVGGKTLRREVRSGGSFLAQSDLRLHFGLGAVAPEDPLVVNVRWADGHVQRAKIDGVDRYVEVRYRR
ncbi:MAG: CRTAC1 family protein [Acidobacteriota bacterium]